MDRLVGGKRMKPKDNKELRELEKILKKDKKMDLNKIEEELKKELFSLEQEYGDYIEAMEVSRGLEEDDCQDYFYINWYKCYPEEGFFDEDSFEYTLNSKIKSILQKLGLEKTYPQPSYCWEPEVEARVKK
jgi:hypothetical protein